MGKKTLRLPKQRRASRNTLIPKIFAAFFIISSVITIFTPLTAAASINTADPEDQARSTTYYKSLRMCVRDNMFGDINITAADNGVAKPSKWFDDNSAFAFVYPDGKKDCKEIAVLAMKLWGWGTNYSQFLRDIGYKYDQTNLRWHGDSEGTPRSIKFESAVQLKYYESNFANDPGLSDTAKYLVYSNTFAKACSPRDFGVLTSITNQTYKSWFRAATADQGKAVSNKLAALKDYPDDTTVYFARIKVVDTQADAAGKPTPVINEHGVTYSPYKANSTWNGGNDGDPGWNQKLYIYGKDSSKGDDFVKLTCHELQKGMSDNAGAWLQWMREHPSENPQVPFQETPTPATDNVTTCAIQGLGWLICPVIDFVANLTDSSFSVLSDNFLRTDVSVVAANDDNGTFVAWSIMRNIANVAFVIVFLIIIFSQLTGNGVSNYGVKKMLPRLVIGAVLVNVSFLVCQLSVDLSNILGYSIRDLFDAAAAQANPDFVKGASPVLAALGENGSLANSFGGVGGILATAGVAAAGYFLLAAGGTLLIAALIALLVTLFILIARQVLIIIAIVIAPIAFVAWILPNTEKVFKQWVGIFGRLLFVFPLIALILGGATLASTILARVAWDQNNLLGQIIAALVPAIALAAVIPALQGAIKSAPALGNLANRITGRANKGVGSKLKESYQGSTYARSQAIRKNAKETFRTQKYAERMQGRSLVSRISRGISKGIPLTKEQQYANQTLARAAYGATEKGDSEDVKFATDQLRRDALAAAHTTGNRDDAHAYAQAQLTDALKKGDQVRARAAFDVLHGMGQAGTARARRVLASGVGDAITKSVLGRHIKSAHPNMKQLDNRINQWAEGNFGAISAQVGKEAHDAGTGDIVGGHLAGLADREIIAQTGESLASGGLSATDAARILADANLQGDIKEVQRAILENIAAGRPPTAGTPLA